MSDRALAYKLLQEIYYDAIDAGDVSIACSAFHPDVIWSHAPVAPHPTEERSAERHVLHGRDAVEARLQDRKQFLAELRTRHKLGQFVIENGVGAARSYAENEAGAILPYTVWFEIRDDLIYRYAVYKVTSPLLQPDEAQDWVAPYA